MYEFKRLSEVFKTSQEILFNNDSRFVIMSDCHRGDGSWADDFLRNRNAFIAALSYYYERNYIYIELGDGDELWENKNFSDIAREHSDVFWLLSKFIRKGRSYFLYGNHDLIKKRKKFSKGTDYSSLDEQDRDHISLFQSVQFNEGLILKHSETKKNIFLIHGHQADYLNDRLAKLSGFLVRYLWRPLELLGFNDPTSAAKNYRKKAAVESKLIEWVKREKQMVIAGHTHRPVLPNTGEPPYFNDGSCVHPRCITAIEIADGNISLVKWSVKTRSDGILMVGRDKLAGPGKLSDYMTYGYVGSKDQNNTKVGLV